MWDSGKWNWNGNLHVQPSLQWLVHRVFGDHSSIMAHNRSDKDLSNFRWPWIIFKATNVLQCRKHPQSTPRRPQDFDKITTKNLICFYLIIHKRGPLKYTWGLMKPSIGTCSTEIRCWGHAQPLRVGLIAHDLGVLYGTTSVNTWYICRIVNNTVVLHLNSAFIWIQKWK